jgi:hypothetical protein
VSDPDTPGLDDNQTLGNEVWVEFTNRVNDDTFSDVNGKLIGETANENPGVSSNRESPEVREAHIASDQHQTALGSVAQYPVVPVSLQSSVNHVNTRPTGADEVAGE